MEGEAGWGLCSSQGGMRDKTPIPNLVGFRLRGSPLNDLDKSRGPRGLSLPICRTSLGVGVCLSHPLGGGCSSLPNCFHMGMWAEVARSSKISVEAKNTDSKV